MENDDSGWWDELTIASNLVIMLNYNLETHIDSTKWWLDNELSCGILCWPGSWLAFHMSLMIWHRIYSMRCCPNHHIPVKFVICKNRITSLRGYIIYNSIPSSYFVHKSLITMCHISATVIHMATMTFISTVIILVVMPLSMGGTGTAQLHTLPKPK